jgi:hypothetical protein
LNNLENIGKKNPAVGPAFGLQPTAPVASSLLRWPGWLGGPKANSPDDPAIGLTDVLARAHARSHRGCGPHGGELTGGPLVAGWWLGWRDEHQRGRILPLGEEATAGTHRASSAAWGW